MKRKQVKQTILKLTKSNTEYMKKPEKEWRDKIKKTKRPVDKSIAGKLHRFSLSTVPLKWNNLMNERSATLLAS